MSEFNPLNHLAQRSIIASDSINKTIEQLSNHINGIPEGETKTYLHHYKFLLESISDLYSLNSLCLNELTGHEDWLKKLHGKVMGKESFTSKTQVNEEGLEQVVRRYKEKETTLDWLHRDLNEISKDLEKLMKKLNE